MTSVWTGQSVLETSGDYSEHQKDYREICEPTWFGGTLTLKTHPVPQRSSDPCVVSGFGMWNEKIYHFHPDQPPSSAGDEI